jgi:hypothetical protein
MTMSQPLLIAQRSEGFTSTSPTPKQTKAVPPPTSIMQINTSVLAHGALLLALLAHDTMSAQSGATQGAKPVAAPHAAPTVTTAPSSEMVKTIITMFGLNRSQAADVLQVRRQSIYNWLGGSEAEGANLERMLSLYRTAKLLGHPIEPHLAIRPTPDGKNSLLRMLSEDRLNRDEVLAWTTALLQPAEEPWPKPLDEILREAGIERNGERERQLGTDSIRHLQG